MPDHNWKLSARDVQEREHWDAYQKAISDVLSKTSSDWAPWYVVRADRKWFTGMAAGAVLINALREIDPRFPRVSGEQRRELRKVKQQLEAEAPDGVAPDP